MSIISKEFFENQDNQQIAKKVAWEINMCLHQAGSRFGNNGVLAAYLLYKVCQYNDPFGITIDMIVNGELDINENIRYLVKERFSEEVWKKLLELITKYSSEHLALAVLVTNIENEMRGLMSTPESVLKLVHELLSVKADERVADICCGCGTYLISAILKQKDAIFQGYEINTEDAAIAQMRSEVVADNMNIKICDVFNLAENEEQIKFDKIFSNYPFGMKLKNLGAGVRYLDKLSEQYPGLSKATSSDWVFNALLYDLIDKNGKAIGIMTNGSTWNSIDIPMRKYFIENKMVECVISLPNKMFSYTSVPTTLIVLSHNNNAIRMIDATNFYQQGRRQNEFSEKNIETIIEALNTDSEYSKLISIQELRDNEYNLNLNRYINGNISFSDGVAFENVIKRITRGAPCTASQLDEMVSDNVTNMQYLMLANIQNGIIDDKLPYLSYIDSKYEKYCLKNNSLILSKNGYPYKVAVASVKEGQHILANGNLYIIELDEEKANPYYLKAFFESEQGIAVLKSITVGATIPNIGVDKLKKVEIPVPSMEEQKKIAEKYQATLDEIAIIKLRLEKAMDKLHHIFDEECE